MTAPAPQRAAAPETAPDRKAESIASPLGGRAAALAAAAVVAAAALVFLPRGVMPGAVVDKKENVTQAMLEQLEKNRSVLEGNGLQAGQIQLRDWGTIDGDAVYFGQLLIGPLQAGPTVVAVGPGPLVLTAKAGSVGCVSVEVSDQAGLVYQLCLKDGDPIKTFAR